MMGDKISAKQAMRARRRADGARHRGRDDRRRGAARPPTRSATRSCSRRARAAAARACGSSSRRTSSRTRSARPRPRPGGVRRPAALRREGARRRRATSRSRCICDHYGNVLTLGERECSIQRRHQKLIEESPSAALTPETREAMEAAAERACRAVGYRNAGTFEFLLGPDGSFYFIELNARLQVEHPGDRARAPASTSCASSCASPPARRSRSPGRAPRRGHAIEIRLNAEDPEHDFRPSPGLIARFSHPEGPGVRLDTFIESGSMIPPFYDSMVAKLIVWDTDRDAAIARARACAARDGDRRRADDARSRARGARERAVPHGRLLDLDARGAAGGDDVTISRRQARRQALFLLYQWDLSGQPIGSQYAGEIDTWARGDRARRSRSARRSSTRASPPPPTAGPPTGSARSSGARCASPCTSSRRDEVPAEVAINEAVAFTKRYASDDGARLVNGILGRIQREEAA